MNSLVCALTYCWTHTITCSVCGSYCNSLLLMSACISVLACPGLVPGVAAFLWARGSLAPSHTSLMLPWEGHSVRARDIPPPSSLPSHPRGTHCWCPLITRGQTWGSRSRWLWNRPRGHVARKLWGLRSKECLWKGRHGLRVGPSASLDAVPTRRRGWRGPTWVFPVCPRREKDQPPRPKGAVGVSVPRHSERELWAGSIPTLSIYVAFLPSCEFTFLKWPMWMALSHTLCMLVIEIEGWELAVTCMLHHGVSR